MSKFNIVSGDWESLNQDAQYVREWVFIQEQQIDAVDEWDEQDSKSLHFIMYDESKPMVIPPFLIELISRKSKALIIV